MIAGIECLRVSIKDAHGFRTENGIMIKRIWGLALATILALTLSNNAQAARCVTSDLEGVWYVEYNYNRPQQVGSCYYYLSSASGFNGICYNATYGLYFQFFSASYRAAPNCSINLSGYMTDGQWFGATGKMNGNKSFASGTLKGRSGGYNLTGKFKMWRQ